jgi:hypothetical protein
MRTIHPEAHLSATLVPGPKGTAHKVCDGCGAPFPAWRHPVEDQWESPDWEAHARQMQRRAQRRRRWSRFLR